MKAATRQPDLFVSPQPSLFDDAPIQPPALRPDEMHGIVRPRLKALMEAVLGASTLPWTSRDAKTNAILFYQMANWLPATERDQLRAAFCAEYVRLGAQCCTYPPPEGDG